MIGRSIDDGVLRITLDRAEKRNALTPGMLHEIATIAATAEREAAEARAILLTGEGDSFCAGFDLTLCRNDRRAMRELLTGLSQAIAALRRAPMPVVVCAHGAAIAGGCALMGGGEVVVTNRDAKLGYPVVRLGVSPAVTSPFLRQSLGMGRMRRRLLDPALFSGADALREGLAGECLETADMARDRAEEIARDLATKPRHAMRVTKRWINELDGSLDDGVIGAALEASTALAGGEEEQARLAALWKKG